MTVSIQFIIKFWRSTVQEILLLLLMMTIAFDWWWYWYDDDTFEYYHSITDVTEMMMTWCHCTIIWLYCYWWPVGWWASDTVAALRLMMTVVWDDTLLYYLVSGWNLLIPCPFCVVRDDKFHTNYLFWYAFDIVVWKLQADMIVLLLFFCDSVCPAISLRVFYSTCG